MTLGNDPPEQWFDEAFSLSLHAPLMMPADDLAAWAAIAADGGYLFAENYFEKRAQRIMLRATGAFDSELMANER